MNNLTGIEAKVLQYIREQELLRPGDGVLAGVSGGADSVCLLFMLLRAREWLDNRLRIEVLHVHHMLRGQEADADMQFVEDLCRTCQVPFHSVCCPVEQTAAEEGMSIEEAGRMIRYREFERLRKGRGLDKTAVAHHQDDHAETVLMNLFRGSGLRGLTGIRPRQREIIRPLLVLSRAEIEQYLSERQMKYRTDSTNLDCRYTRNRIRRELLPYLEANINARAAGHVVQFAALAEEVDCYFQKKADRLFEKYGTNRENMAILCLDCLDAEELELSYLVRNCIEASGAGLKDVGRTHIAQILQLMKGETGGKLSLPGGLQVEKSYRHIIFSRAGEGDRQEHGGAAGSREIEIRKGEAPVLVQFSQAEFTFSVKIVKKNRTFPKKKYTKWFDYDKIKSTLCLRTRQSGDYIVINKAGGRKKLKDYFIDSRVPRQDRDQVILLADGAEVLWVVGLRISEAYKIQEDTRTILEVVCRGAAYAEE